MIDTFETPLSVSQNLASRVKKRRVALQLTQAELAQKAGMPLATYRRFEQKGQITLIGLLQVAFSLDCMHDFDALFASPTWATMDDMLNHTKPSKRVRHD